MLPKTENCRLYDYKTLPWPEIERKEIAKMKVVYNEYFVFSFVTKEVIAKSIRNGGNNCFLIYTDNDIISVPARYIISIETIESM